MCFRVAPWLLTAATILAVPAAAASGVPADELDEYGRGIISDYSDMAPTDALEWAWKRPGLRLSDHRIEVAKFANKTKLHDRGLIATLNEAPQEALDGLGNPAAGSAPVLTADGALYWAERANKAKTWIPFGGAHMAQAGVGIELVLRDASGGVVAKIRHSGREGDDLEDAANEVLDEVIDYLRSK